MLGKCWVNLRDCKARTVDSGLRTTDHILMNSLNKNNGQEQEMRIVYENNNWNQQMRRGLKIVEKNNG